MTKRRLAGVLARAFLAGEPTAAQVVERAAHTLGREWHWLRPLAIRYIRFTLGQTRPRQRDVVRFLLGDAGFRRACQRYGRGLRIEHWLAAAQRMQPVGAAAGWAIPAIDSTGALCEWLSLRPGELEWLADLKALNERGANGFRHYHYRLLAKATGSVRLIEMPKPRLKELQRRILREILDQVPMHRAVHGFVAGRSIRTFAAPHVGQRVVLRMDLRDFFVSFAGVRIQSFFRTAGYPEAVADLLGGLCTNAAPSSVWKDEATVSEELRAMYGRPHLPQGAPTSPALANICARRLDLRLAGLAEAAGAVYTRYADDLGFSGGREFEKGVDRFAAHAAAIAMEEGFAVHHRKTRVMREGVRQHLAGLVVNERANVMRPDFDKLKATLTNCVRHGAASQNREGHAEFRAHLKGRVAFVESVNPEKAKRLRALFERIEWE